MSAGAKGGGGRARKGQDQLAPDERALWDHAAQTMAPLKRGKARVLARAGEDLVEPPPRPPSQGKRPSQSESTRAAAPDPAPGKRARAGASTGAPPLAEFNRKAARRLRSGQIDIESRIDLHGMRQDEAHLALRRFLFASQRRGERWVLVITGKGAPRREGGGRAGAESDDPLFRPQPGVLKRSVPRWIDEPDLRAIVVSTTEAAIHHGGSGALYVQLRKFR